MPAPGRHTACMKPVTTYWLCRTTGAATEGPFTFGQIKAMYQTGAINAEALICPNGEEEWMEARWMLEAADEARQTPAPAPQPQVVYVREKKDKKGTCGCMTAVACLIGLLVVLRIAGGGSNASSTDYVYDLQADVRRWVRTELADKNAELMGMSEPAAVNGKFYRIVRLRGKNAFGGPVINDFVSISDKAESISWMVSLQQFKKTAKYNHELGPDGVAKIEAALKFKVDE